MKKKYEQPATTFVQMMNPIMAPDQVSTKISDVPANTGGNARQFDGGFEHSWSDEED